MIPNWASIGDRTTWATSTRIDVIPLHDIVAHDIVGDCVCVPREELLTQGPDRWMYVHHSLDNREATEPRRADGSG